MKVVRGMLYYVRDLRVHGKPMQRLARSSESRGWRWVEMEQPEGKRREGSSIISHRCTGGGSAWRAANIVGTTDRLKQRDGSRTDDIALYASGLTTLMDGSHEHLAR